MYFDVVDSYTCTLIVFVLSVFSAEVCANVTCEEVETLTLECPSDSVPLPSVVYHNGCCSKYQGYVVLFHSHLRRMNRYILTDKFQSLE